MERATLIIPCYNEARRLDTAALASLLDDDGIDLLFVDDGSADTTREILEGFARTRPQRIRVLALEQNSGKAEAVRRGLAAAIEHRNAELVGYFDADLATPPAEIRRLVGILRAGTAQVLFGARVALLGHRIERSTGRHYLGRVFATLASMALHLPTYDTQCGAKLFRVTPGLENAVQERFLSRWAFDVELLGRLLTGSAAALPIPVASVWEEPLRAWRDVKGSKLAPRQMARALLDLARIERDLSRRRARMATHGLGAGTPAPGSADDARAARDPKPARAPR
jgi:glycosyltransferase involved in cell wall biosynthesis